MRPKTGGVALGDALEMGETAEGRFASLFLGLDSDEKGVGISYTLGGINSLATNNESGAVLADPPLA